MCFVYRGEKGSLANQAWSGKNMILMEDEWSVRDVCFLFCLDYPWVMSFILLAPLSSPSSPQTLLHPSNYSPREQTHKLQNCKHENRALQFCLIFPMYARAISATDVRRPKVWRVKKESSTLESAANWMPRAKLLCDGTCPRRDDHWDKLEHNFPIVLASSDKCTAGTGMHRLDKCDFPPSLTINGATWNLFEQRRLPLYYIRY